MNQLQILTHVDPEAWNAEVVRLKGSPFHSYEWSRFSSDYNQSEPIFIKWGNETGAAEAIGLAQIERKGFASCSIWTALSMGSFPAVTQPEYLRESLRTLINYCEKHSVGSLELHSFGTPLGTEILQELGFQVEKRWEFLVHIEGSEDELWRRVHTKKRNLIRKGRKEKLGVKRAAEFQDVMQFRALAVETYNRKTQQGVSFPQPAEDTYYRLLKERLIDAGLGRLYMAYEGDQAIGGAFFVGFNATAYYMLSSATEEGLRKAAPDLILWTAMTDFLKEGFRLFNLGGLSERELEGRPLEESGLYHFKKRFGAEVHPCYKGRLILRPTQFKLYSLLKTVKSRLSR